MAAARATVKFSGEMAIKGSLDVVVTTTVRNVATPKTVHKTFELTLAKETDITLTKFAAKTQSKCDPVDVPVSLNIGAPSEKGFMDGLATWLEGQDSAAFWWDVLKLAAGETFSSISTVTVTAVTVAGGPSGKGNYSIIPYCGETLTKDEARINPIKGMTQGIGASTKTGDLNFKAP